MLIPLHCTTKSHILVLRKFILVKSYDLGSVMFTWSSFFVFFPFIQDEVHERDRFSDFLLIKLRDVLQSQANLKLIISSAALDADLFIRYFGCCPVIHSKYLSKLLNLSIPALRLIDLN